MFAAVGFNVDSNSGNLKLMSGLSETVPIADYVTSTSDSTSVTFTFSGYEDHYLYSVLLNEAATEVLETITSD